MIRSLGIAIFTVLFLGTMFGGLFHMTMGMDMTGEMSGCPFMTHEATLCSMSVTDHIESWKSAFLAAVPGFTLLLLALAATAIILTIAPHLLLKRRWAEPLISKHVLERVYTFSYRPLQELFSRGILHPKLY